MNKLVNCGLENRFGTNCLKWDGLKSRFGNENLIAMWVADMDFKAPQPVILGYVGAGGIGLILNEKIGWREYDRVGMILVMLFITVLIIENGSKYIRERLG